MGKCIKCDNKYISWRHKQCQCCWEQHLKDKRDICANRTLKFYREGLAIKGKHPSWKNTQIRQFARTWHKDLIENPCCEHCGFDKHVELAHIKDVASFPDSATVGEVNARDNIIPLCPNCHWIFDNLTKKKPIIINQSVIKKKSLPRKKIVIAKIKLIKIEESLSFEFIQKRVMEIPLKKLAAELKISHTTLFNFCKKYEVKIPDLGHWNKLSYKNKTRKPFSSTGTYSPPTKITWPTCEELRFMVWETPRSILAKQLGVSDKAISKRCNKLGIDQPPRGYWAKLNAADDS